LTEERRSADGMLGMGLRLLVALGDHPGTPTRYSAKSSPNSYSDDESSARSFQGWLNHPGVAGKSRARVRFSY
jgi:hypothetical protein